MRVNERIRVREVRVIDENGQQLGILPTFEALRTARERGLDLVEVAPNAVPPVCRILDFGKFKYEQQKKESEARKNARQTEIKEVRLTPNTDEHDFDTTVRKARSFLEEGDKVKVTVKLKSRAIIHPQLGREMLEKLAQAVQGVGTVERGSLMEGRNMTMIISPVRSQQSNQTNPPAANQPRTEPTQPRQQRPRTEPATEAQQAG